MTTKLEPCVYCGTMTDETVWVPGGCSLGRAAAGPYRSLPVCVYHIGEAFDDIDAQTCEQDELAELSYSLGT